MPRSRNGTIRRAGDVGLVALHELRDSLRSKKAIVLLLLYTAGAAAASGIFLAVLAEMEEMLAHGLGVATTRRPGAMTHALVTSDEFRVLVSGLVGDDALAAELVRMPPMALFYGWLALTFVPILVVLTSADAIAQDRQRGTSRFTLLRTDRGAWAAGKLLGHTALSAVGVACGAAATWVVGALFLRGFAPWETLVALSSISLRATVYAAAWVGIALGLSQLVRNANAARALGLGALVVLGVLGLTLLTFEDRWPVLSGVLGELLPGAHKVALWQPRLLERLPALVVLPALGGLYFTLGHLVFRRRDA